MKPRGNVLWYLAAIFILPGMIVLSIILSQLLGIEIPLPMNPIDSGKDIVAAVVLSSGYGTFFGNAVGEEVGWRGFALSRFQARYSPLIASLILAFPSATSSGIPEQPGASFSTVGLLPGFSIAREGAFYGWSLPCVL